MPSDRVRELKKEMDELVSRADLSRATHPEERRVFEEAIRNFRNAGPELLDEATPFLWAFYRKVVSGFDVEELEMLDIPELVESMDIWEEVEFFEPPTLGRGGTPLQPGRSYLSFEGEVSWEVEHGLQLVFEHGERVCKVSRYDGHSTNASAHDDPALLGVVFR